MWFEKICLECYLKYMNVFFKLFVVNRMIIEDVFVIVIVSISDFKKNFGVVVVEVVFW